MKQKVLYDLSSVFHGFAGIPQDARTIFLALSQLKNIDLTGLLSGVNSDIALHRFGAPSQDELTRTFSYSTFLLALNDEYMRRHGIVDQEFRGVLRRSLDFVQVVKRRLKSILHLFKKEYSLYPHEKVFNDFIWKLGFANFVDYEYKSSIVNQNFKATNFSKYFMKKRMLRGYSPIELDTEEFDFVVFQDGMPACPNVSPRTVPIIRFHDMVPLLYPDTIKGAHEVSNLFYKSLTQIHDRAIFVCNSAPTREELLKFVPALEKRAVVIPPVLLGKSMKAPGHSVSRIMGNYLSSFSRSLGVNAKQFDGPVKYIISASTIEPRKNFMTLIQAWEQVASEHEELKLVIVGSPGWKCDLVLNAMRPHILRGNIIHLEKLPLDDLRVLYSNAEAFVFPTTYEGFGSTPVEAMQSGCPVIASDISVMHWVLGDAALYCDPEDKNSVADVISLLLYSPEGKTLAENYVKRGYQQVEKYSLNAVAEQWGNLFDRLSAGSPGE